MHRRLFVLSALALSACAGQPPLPEGPVEPLTLDEAFTGRKRGAGLFRVWLTGDERRFTARLDGRLSRQGQRLTVVEDFVYGDGQENRLTWVFDRSGPGRWRGRREDTVGEASVIEENGVIRLSYTADFVSLGSTTRLSFEDVIYRRPDGLIVNDAIVSRAGLPVGAVRFEIRQ